MNSFRLSNPCMSDSTWPLDPYQTDGTYLSAPTMSISPGRQICIELISSALQILTESSPRVFQIHAPVTPPGLVILTELTAHTFLQQFD